MKGIKSVIILGLYLSGAAAIASSADTGLFDEYNRSGKFEVYGLGEVLTGWQTTSSSGVNLKFDTGYGGGLGAAYNFNNHLALNTDFSVGSLSLTGTGYGYSESASGATLRWYGSLDYNILRRRLTPFVTAGGGLIGFYGTWSGAATFSETDPAWGVGGGLRWDISDHWYVKALYRANWTSLQGSSSTTLFHSITLGIGFSF